MPELAWQVRQQGGFNPAKPGPLTVRQAKPCRCGRTDTRLYQTGPCCPLHTPAASHGRPEPPTPVQLDRPRLTVRDQSRYGRATTDPLGRDGAGWHKGTHGLPVRTKRETEK